MRRAWLLVAVGLVLTACGGADDTGATTVTTEPVASSTTTDPVPAETAPEATAPADTVATTTTTVATETTEPSQEDGPEESSDSLPSPPPSEAAPVPPGFEALVASARADLASRLSVDEAEIRVASAEAVVWPDSSLGCPQPDMAYTQVQVDGFRIVLEHGAVGYAYHGGGSRTEPFYCAKPIIP